MTKRWAKRGLDPSSEVQEFLGLAFSMLPHSPNDAVMIVDEIGVPPKRMTNMALKYRGWPASGAALAKAEAAAAIIWDLKDWAAQVREAPSVIAVRVCRNEIRCLGVRPRPIARYLSMESDQPHETETTHIGRKP